MRELNQRAVLNRLRFAGPATRPLLARDTGLSKPTVGQALLDLERRQLVREIGRTSTGPGRSAVVYGENPAAGFVLGVDVGRERLRLAVADLSGAVVSRVDERNRCRSARSLVNLLKELGEHTVSAAGISQGEVVAKVIGSPGVPDAKTGALQHAQNLPGWGRRGLLEELTAALGQGVVVENDANLAAVGEMTAGAARGADTFVSIMVGTGIGMGIVVNGQLFRGAHGAAGEIGYLPYGTTQGTPPDRGMLETEVSGDSVVRKARQHGLEVKSAKDVFELARKGDKPALRAVTEEAKQLAFVVGAVAAVIDPELVVLGGGIGSNTDLLAEPLEEALHSTTPLRPKIVTGELGETAVLSGAIAMGLGSAREVVFDRALELKTS
ncbi:ROK family transcriptional regulator [Kibdelosporangium phytohabitans]|uniref:ROK family transcriptional regulator n=1 Tax=Kibdelosporangium phytohabitans TaxID=860235 RepID=A0A0N9IB05_9PSEU|nr:ROK family protein [Kibdelosporangium phytohabitans]ALG13337.1 ROK family transcriptional regulator [Kibdelosporangium phytohabitans]